VVMLPNLPDECGIADGLHWSGVNVPVARIPKLRRLLRYICEKGFEHRVAANLSARQRCWMRLLARAGTPACSRSRRHDRPRLAGNRTRAEED